MTRIAVAVCVWAVVFSWSQSAGADSESVGLRVDGSASARTALEQSVRESVKRIGLVLDTSLRDCSKRGTLAFVTIDLRATDVVRIVVRECGPGEGSVSREVDYESGSSIARERTVLVVRSTLDAIVVAARASGADSPAVVAPSASGQGPGPGGPAEGSGAPALPRDGSGARPPRRWDFDGGAFARTSSFARGAPPLWGGGVDTTFAAWRGPWHPSLELSFAAYVPQSAAQGPVHTDLTVENTRMNVGIAPFDRGGWQLAAGVGFGVDVITIQVDGPGPGARAPQPGTQLDPVLVGVVGLRAPLVKGVGIVASFETDVDLNAQGQGVDGMGPLGPVPAPWPIRFSGSLGVMFQPF